jgi:hypothetical protein
MRSANHHAPLSILLLSAVHPVTLYTPTQPSTVPLQAGLCALSHPPPPFDCTPPSALQRERRALRTTVLVQQ